MVENQWRPMKDGSVEAGFPAQAIVVAVILIAALSLLHETVGAMVDTWSISSTYSHGFLIVPICLYLAWKRRSALSVVEVRPALGGVAVVAVASIGWLVGEATGTLIVQEFCAVAIAHGVIWATCGWAICRKLAFPLIYLYFAVPFGQAMVPPLQSVTASLAVAMLRGVGIPVFEDGNVISIPTGSFYVAEACSGIRFLIASMALGTLFAGTIYRSWWRRAAFVGLSFAVPILANGIRAFGIILIADLTSNEFAVGVDHIIYGWIFFTLVTALTLLIGLSFRDGAAGSNAAARVAFHPAGRAKDSRRALMMGLLAVIPIVLVKAYGGSVDRKPLAALPPLGLPRIESPWGGHEGSEDPAAPVFAAPDAQLHADFMDGTRRAYLHIGYYLWNRRGAQVVSSAQKLDGGEFWIGAATGTVAVTIDGKPVTVQFARMVKGDRGHLVWYWYWVDSRFTGNPYLVKLLEAKAKLIGGEQRAAVIVVGADYAGAPIDAEKVLRSLLDSISDLSKYLDGSAKP